MTGRSAQLPRGRPKKRSKPQKRDLRVFPSYPSTEMARNLPISVLPLSPTLIAELTHRGFQTVGDLAALTALHAVQISGMNGWHWRSITIALGRKQFPNT